MGSSPVGIEYLRVVGRLQPAAPRDDLTAAFKNSLGFVRLNPAVDPLVDLFFAGVAVAGGSCYPCPSWAASRGPNSGFGAFGSAFSPGALVE